MCNFLARFGIHRIACVFSFLYFTCMGLHMILLYHVMCFARYDSIFCLGYPFPDSFDEMGFLMHFVGDGQTGFEVECCGYPN